MNMRLGDGRGIARFRHVCIMVMTAWVVASTDASAAWAGGDLRLYILRSEVFGYLLTAVSIGTDHVPVLAFKELTGTTRFVRPGEKLGDWTVTAYQPRTEKVFHPSVGAQFTVDTSTAVLRRADGQERVLTVGLPLEQPGRMACFVSLASGAWAYACGGDTITLDGLIVTVLSIGEAVAQVRTADRIFDVPQVTDHERQTVLNVWRLLQQQAEARTLAQTEAQQRKMDDRAAAEARAAAQVSVTHSPQQSSRFSFSTEYRYPIEYEVLPFTMRMSDGSMRNQVVVVPTRFGTRSAGISHEVR